MRQLTVRAGGSDWAPPLGPSAEHRDLVVAQHVQGPESAAAAAGHQVHHAVVAPCQARLPLMDAAGGTLPFLAQRIGDSAAYWQQGQPEPAIGTWRKMWWNSANFHGPRRVPPSARSGPIASSGSDFPYFPRDLYPRARTYIEDAGLSPVQVKDIVELNSNGLPGL
ncbi:hypothetical protein [Kibdelosporangium phytohabitans]|uniref:Uncharacterized protein n=1 Tax=Kibdelosporangium phytohabitans TaxID=860235 RepID=A0A0N9I7H5_9PSEU|nr:hypothetical protein [Kibdelosporangium phytohabitans]ALG12106.1 hypothetical protein AOZ06_39245 [Kibdelosporangium phytohabitans]MBE1463602.1 hypothetical protein [Kibdelosporangium phytohabitans]